MAASNPKLREALQAHKMGNFPHAAKLYQVALAGDPKNDEALASFARLQFQMNNQKGAFELSVNALNLNPKNSKAHATIGLIYTHTGQFDEATKALGRALEITPNDLDAAMCMSMIHINRGEAEEAILLLTKTTRQHKKSDHALVNLGLAQKMAGDYKSASQSFRKATSLNAKNHVAFTNLGSLYIELQRYEEAKKFTLKALDQNNTSLPDAYHNLAVIEHKANNFEAAYSALEKVLALNPHHLQSLVLYGRWAGELGKEVEAEQRLRPVWEAGERGIVFIDAFVTVLSLLGCKEDALAIAKSGFETHPDDVKALEIYLVALQVFGEFDTVRDVVKAVGGGKNYRRVAYSYLSGDKGYRFSSEELKEVESLRDEVSFSESDKGELSFVLAGQLEKAGEFEKSFKCYKEANECLRRSFNAQLAENTKVLKDPYDQQLRDAEEFASSEVLTSSRISQKGEITPIFILGMPRSGTTLVEGILGRHSQVKMGGELPLLSNLVQQLSAKLQSKENIWQIIPDIDAEELLALANAYRSYIEKRAKGATAFTDKMPHNFLHVGLISMLFPDAKIIHCMRDPMDVCFSIYQQSFSVEHRYACDLTAIGKHYLGYQKLMDHWHTVCPSTMLDVPYENVIADQDVWVAKLIEFCGLPPEERLMEKQVSGAVQTASLWQVRQPVYKTSVAKWKRFEDHLGPLKEALGIE